MREKSKAPLVLMEQAIMMTVFIFAAAVCMLAFTKAKKQSEELVTRDRAIILCQTVAETVKASKGKLYPAAELLGAVATEEELFLYYDEEWNSTDKADAVYKLHLCCMETEEYLTESEVSVTDIESGKLLFSIPVSWQEVQNE